MKKFRFRLERVLQYRTTVKEEKLRDLMLRNAELHQLETHLEALLEALLRNGIGSNSTMTVEQVYLAGLFSARMEAEIEDAKLKIALAQREVDKALEIYKQAAKEEKALLTLKDKKREEYERYVQQEDIKFIDEIATMKGNTFET